MNEVRCRSLLILRSCAAGLKRDEGMSGSCAGDRTNPFAAAHTTLAPERSAQRRAARIVNPCRSLLILRSPASATRMAAGTRRFAQLTARAGRPGFASACRFLLISRAAGPALAVPRAQPTAAGIVNACRSLLIPHPSGRRQREPGRAALVATRQRDCGRHGPPR
jgi:hypothetical protein